MPIHLLVINEAGYESGLDDLSAMISLPILQDDVTAEVWTRWEADWRDVFVLDADNERALVYNLTVFDLSDPDNYADLKAYLIDTAEGG